MILEIIKVIVLGIIQGITEWLPISSTGHMILMNDLFPLTVYADQTVNQEFVDMFLVVIQFGSILAVLLLYWPKLNPFIKNSKKRNKIINLWLKVAVAAVPGAVIGFLFDDVIDQLLYNPITVAIMLIVYGVIFIIIENRQHQISKKDIYELTFTSALMIGLFQVLALIPGTSRSGATILGAILIGCARPLAAEFSFFLAVPMMFGASLLKIIKLKVALDASGYFLLILGMIVAFVVSIIAIKTFIRYLRKHDFKPFGYYRLVLGVIVLITMFF